MADQYLMVWWGENALESEWEVWRKLQQSEKLSDIRFLETLTREEDARLHTELEADGWKLQSTGRGSVGLRISVYKKTS